MKDFALKVRSLTFAKGQALSFKEGEGETGHRSFLAGGEKTGRLRLQ